MSIVNDRLAAGSCKHSRLQFTDGAGGLYLECQDCPRRFVAGLKSTLDLPDYHARIQFFTKNDTRLDPFAPPVLVEAPKPPKPKADGAARMVGGQWRPMQLPTRQPEPEAPKKAPPSKKDKPSKGLPGRRRHAIVVA